MDFLKKAAAQAASGSSHKQSTHQQQPQGEKQDYVDKAFAMAAKKSGHNIDSRTAEKITDTGRGFFEKLTGKKVDPKISN